MNRSVSVIKDIYMPVHVRVVSINNSRDFLFITKDILNYELNNISTPKARAITIV